MSQGKMENNVQVKNRCCRYVVYYGIMARKPYLQYRRSRKKL